METFEHERTHIAELEQEPSKLHSEWLGLIGVAQLASSDEKQREVQSAKDQDEKLEFDYTPVGRRMVLVSITMPDGGKITRTTEPIDGRDKEGGYRKLKGYTLPNGILLEKEIHRNSDGSISLIDLDVENRKPDRHVQRMSQAEFIEFVRKFKGDESN